MMPKIEPKDEVKSQEKTSSTNMAMFNEVNALFDKYTVLYGYISKLIDKGNAISTPDLFGLMPKELDRIADKYGVTPELFEQLHKAMNSKIKGIDDRATVPKMDYDVLMGYFKRLTARNKGQLGKTFEDVLKLKARY